MKSSAGQLCGLDLAQTANIRSIDAAQIRYLPAQHNRYPEAPLKHAVIFAHPRDHSFTGSLAESYARAAGGLGHSVLTRDLYRMKFSSTK